MSTTDISMAPAIVPFDHCELRGDTWYAIDQMGNERGQGEIQYEAVLGFAASLGVVDWVQQTQRRAPRLAECGRAPRGAGSHYTTRYVNGWIKSDRQTPYVHEYKGAAFTDSRNIRRTFLRASSMLKLSPGDEFHRLALFSPLLAYFRPATIQTLQHILNHSGRYFAKTGSDRGRYYFTYEAHAAAAACAVPATDTDLALRVSDVYVFTRLHHDQEISARVDPVNRSITITVGGSRQEGTETLLMLRSDGVKDLKREDSTNGVLDWIVGGEYTWERYARY